VIIIKNCKNKKIKEKAICIIYCLVIFVSMYPSKKDYSNLANLNSIIPGINKIYDSNNKNYKNKKENYTFKSFEIIKKYMNN
jgi:hypothetical protein